MATKKRPPTASPREAAPSLASLLAPEADAPRTSASHGQPRARRRSTWSMPWERPIDEWDDLEPSSIYASWLRTPALYLVALGVAPLALLCALPIAFVNTFVNRGPHRVLFRQPRVGRRGRVFILVKFRTMRGGAAEGEEEDDVRVTRFGRFLRNTHLDELPQIWNVLKGDMCLIGPRPEMLSIERWAMEQAPGFLDRLVLRPGITGWAQVTQGYAPREPEAYREKARRNHRYLTEIGLRRDLEILLRTGFWMLFGRGWRWKEQAKTAGEPEIR